MFCLRIASLVRWGYLVTPSGGAVFFFFFFFELLRPVGGLTILTAVELGRVQQHEMSKCVVDNVREKYGGSRKADEHSMRGLKNMSPRVDEFMGARGEEEDGGCHKTEVCRGLVQYNRPVVPPRAMESPPTSSSHKAHSRTQRRREP